MGANTYGRQVIESLTNKSGAGVVAGDVVVVDTTNNDAFTTNTAGSFLGIVGIAQETIANNATGRVLTAGYAALVNVNASVTRGHFGITYTVAKQATDGGASRVTGGFCQFLTGGATPDAHLFGMPDGSSATANVATDPIWAAAGDLAVGTGSHTAAVLTKGAAGGVLTMGNGAVTWGVGTSFPGSKATGDRFWRSDLGLEFYWDGTRWLSVELFEMRWGMQPWGTISVDTIIAGLPLPGFTTGIYLVDQFLTANVATTNDGSHYWKAEVHTQQTANGADAVVTPTLDTSTLTAGGWYGVSGAIGAVSAGPILIYLKMAKVSTPGAAYYAYLLRYRLIGT